MMRGCFGRLVSMRRILVLCISVKKAKQLQILRDLRGKGARKEFSGRDMT